MTFDRQRLSATTFPLTDRSLDDALAVIADAGLSRVDLLERKPHLAIDGDEAGYDAVAAAVAARGMTIANLATYGGKGFTTGDDTEAEAAWAQVTAQIDLAQRFGARTVRVYSIGSGNEAVEHIPRIAPWYRKAAAYAGDRGVWLGVENHGGAISGEPARTAELCEAVGHDHFGVLYDPANLLRVGTDYKPALDAFRDHVVHVHLKDATSERQSCSTTMLGDGDIDIPWLLDQIDAMGYTGEVTLEYEVNTVPVDEGLNRWVDTFLAIATK